MGEKTSVTTVLQEMVEERTRDRLENDESPIMELELSPFVYKLLRREVDGMSIVDTSDVPEDSDLQIMGAKCSKSDELVAVRFTDE